MYITPLLLYLLTLALSLTFLFWAADRMLLNAVAVSQHFHVPPLIIGALVIGFGTSAPELVVSSVAAVSGSTQIAVGNAIGSNVANVALVLGAAALLSGVSATYSALHRNFLLLLAATALPGLLLLDQRDLSRGDGLILLAALVVAVYLLVKFESDAPPPDDEIQRRAVKQRHAEIRLVGFTGLLVAFSYLAVWAAVNLAEALDVSELIIGLTVLAIGTSLPELSTVLVGAYRKQHAMAIGNVIGSNVFNSLAVIGLPVLIAPAQMPPQVLVRDYPVMLGLTVLLPVLFLVPPRGRVGRGKGLLLLACFFAYQLMLYRAAFT